MRRSKEQERADWVAQCRQFNGLGQASCRAGVDYETVKVRHDPIEYDPPYKSTLSIPCLGARHNYCGTAACGKYEPRTEAEYDTHRKELDEAMANYLEARKRIVAQVKGRRGMRGTIDCPKCGGKASLAFSVASSNGHIWGHCSTTGCLQWME